MNARTGTGFDHAYIPGAANIASGPNRYVVRLALPHPF
ncbi:outer membrane porin OpcP [Burkholderia pseudomallei]|nr:outer membrane porin OpcP [Burkholderia pseudomallei]CAJ9062667.1 outer membrane porin OpcP [Burkholderia pseudomallei]